MKNLIIVPLGLIAIAAVTASGQVKSVTAANKQPGAMTTAPSRNPADATRTRVLARESKTAAPGSYLASNGPTGNRPAFNNHSKASASRVFEVIWDKGLASGMPPATNTDVSNTGTVFLKPAGSISTSSVNPPANPIVPVATVPSQLYRVGIRDVLDIQLADTPSTNSTLFTVLDDGKLEYPLAGDPISVAGLTVPEIAGLLSQKIKFFENPDIAVNVRDYASHTVTITGFVGAPGIKTLRREAVPLYTLLAEAMVFPEGGTATITHQGRAAVIVDLKDPNLTSTLVVPGDSVKVSGAPAAATEFFFAGGEINVPGQKTFHAGLTVTQAILASGGTKLGAGTKVRLSRQGADGRLVTEEYNLRKIQSGRIPDPLLRNGDRIEVTAN